MTRLSLLRIAWQDSRGSRGKLLLFLSSLILGVAALIFALLIRSAIQTNIDAEAKSLLGADLSLRGKAELATSLLKSLSTKRFAEEIQLRSMASFFGSDGVQSRLAQVRAFRGEYPFYGDIRTNPPGIWQAVLSSDSDALVDESLLIQTGAKIGDKLTLGEKTFTIRGIVEKFPGSLSISGAVAPRIYIARSAVAGTGLLGKMSLADYYLYAELGQDLTLEAIKQIRAELSADEQLETVSDRRERLGRVNEQLALFLGLVAVLCIMLGGVGAGIALFFFLRAKAGTVALLRCLGASGSSALLVVLSQIALSAGLALLFGVMIGLAAYSATLSFLSQALDLELIRVPISAALSIGFLIGLVIVALASTPGFFLLRDTRALDLLRSGKVAIGRSAIVIWGLLVFIIPFFLLWSLDLGRKQLLIVGLVINGALLLLWVFARLNLRAFEMVHKQIRSWFELKHALRRLSRNRASAALLLVSLTVTAILLSVLLIVRATLVGNVERVRDENTANLFVYDVGPEDLMGVGALLKEHQLQVAEDVPIVLMRITKVKDKEVNALLSDPTSGVPAWTLRREYWSSFRDQLVSNEEVVAGDWINEAPKTGVTPISIEDRLARNLGVWVGDQIEFSIQGVRLMTKIASVRKIYWEQMRRNAFVIFPKGALEEAPQFRFLTVYSPDTKKTADFQRALAQRYPGVSAIDLRHAVETVFGLLNKILVGAGVLVALVGLTAIVLVVIMLISARSSLIRESALLGTLGARGRQIQVIFFIEQGMLALSALVLAIPITWSAATLVAILLKRTDILFPWQQIGMLGVGMLSFVLLFSWLAGASSIKQGLAQAVRVE